ncbi:osteopontin [Megalops cyprinoides]|uniref:osteopontin n=1 Tax=Megalops cyprinoides TaxID=118141 RepID=UPI0018641A8C|nr:osteopontin [Megalops cyprinoides]
MTKRSVKRSASSSESSEEVVKPARMQLKAPAALPKAAPVQTVTAGSDESSDSSDEAQSDDDDDDTDSDDTDEADTDESESAEFEETTTAPPAPIETTLPPVIDNGRGDSLGYPGDYKKSIVYVESNKIEKEPSSYKFYGVDKAEEGLVSKKTSVYDAKDGNDIEKNLKVYKALQVHEDIMEEDTSTPEVESQGLDMASGTVEEPTHRQAPQSAPEESEATESEGESTSASMADSVSTSEESDGSQSSEEATATPGAADSDSSDTSESEESDSNETEETSEAPVVITAK